MSIHRILEGDWAECSDGGCELKFHFDDLSLTEAKALPLQALLPLFDILDPATSVWDDQRTWSNEKGYLHRDYDLPAIVFADGTMEWWQDHQLHRDGDKPARVYPDGSLEWYDRGRKHRVNAPAVIDADGSELWYAYDMHHRAGGPSATYANGYQEWMQQGKFHREDGPAVIRPDGRSEYWVNGIPVRQVS